jgi:opacity protein-like surface antigen
VLRRSVLLGAVSIATLALALSAAEATQTVRIASHISITGKQLKFSGKVTSPNAACKQGRHVTLYRKLSGGGHAALGSTTTGASGKWHVTVSGSAGISLSHFYATVRRRSEGTAGTIFVCKAARSRTIAFHQ